MGLLCCLHAGSNLFKLAMKDSASRLAKKSGPVKNSWCVERFGYGNHARRGPAMIHARITEMVAVVNLCLKRPFKPPYSSRAEEHANRQVSGLHHLVGLQLAVS